MTGEYMSGYQDGTIVAKGVAESLLAQANSEKATLIRRIDELCQENEQMRKTAAMLANARTNLLAENAKLKELARGLGQCSQGVDCEECLLYDLSEPDHCREERLSRELGIEVPDGEV